MDIQEIQDRVQELYNIVITDFTHEEADELRQLEEQAKTMGYERVLGDINNIRYVKVAWWKRLLGF